MERQLPLPFGPIQPLVPDLVLRDAYLNVANQVGCWREKFIADTANIEALKHELGPTYSHVSPDWLRRRIVDCAKNPERHGGGWGKPTRPAKGRKAPRQISPEYAAYLDSTHFKVVREIVLQRDNHRCRICNSPDNLDVHHRSYENVGHADWLVEARDCTTACRSCHDVIHHYVKIIDGKRQ